MSESESEHGKLTELLELTRENNRMLHSMYRRMFWSQVFTYIYWLLILGVMGWSYYYLQPYISQYWELFQNINNQLSKLENGGISFPAEIRSILEKIR